MSVFLEVHPPVRPPSSTHATEPPGERPAPVVLLHGGTAARWMWAEQVDALRDRLVLTLDLPGFGERAAETWPGLDAAADAVVTRVGELGIAEPFHLVGLSLGAVTALRVVARHPGRVLSTFATGAIVKPVSRTSQVLGRLQIALWDARWFWRLQARLYGLDDEGRAEFVAHGLTLRRENMAAIAKEVYPGGLPRGLGAESGRILAIAAEHDPVSIRDSLALIGSAAPQAELRLAPRMHHIWNIEDVDLFNGVLLAWLRGEVDARLLRV